MMIRQGSDLRTLLTRKSSGRYLPYIDGLRFLALAPVLLHHLCERVYRKIEATSGLSAFDEFLIKLVPSGRMGVELFFCISGFVICNQLRKGRLGYKTYLVRRLTRLEPPYILAMSVIFLGLLTLDALGIGFLQAQSARSANEEVSLVNSYLASLGYLHGVLFEALPRINPPAWSLEIEFQFYLLAPLLLLLASWLRVGINRPRVIVISILLLVLGVKLVGDLMIPEPLQRYLVPYWLEFFAFGMALSFIADRIRTLPERGATQLFLVSMIIWLVADHFRFTEHWLQGGITMLGLWIGVIGVFAATLAGGIWQRAASTFTISRLGGMCYSVYLLHLLLLQVIVAVLFQILPMQSFPLALLAYGIISLPVVIVISAIFFVLVERPCMDPAWPGQLMQLLRRRRARSA